MIQICSGKFYGLKYHKTNQWLTGNGMKNTMTLYNNTGPLLAAITNGCARYTYHPLPAPINPNDYELMEVVIDIDKGVLDIHPHPDPTKLMKHWLKVLIRDK